jgi:hypothetical protein
LIDEQHSRQRLQTTGCQSRSSIAGAFLVGTVCLVACLWDRLAEWSGSRCSVDCPAFAAERRRASSAPSQIEPERQRNDDANDNKQVDHVIVVPTV